MTWPFGSARTCAASVEPAEHLRHGRHELDGVGPSPAISAVAERRAHPERDRQRAVRDSGPEDERQDRHELGVDRQQRHRRAGDPELRALTGPAWTDAISSSADAKSVPPPSRTRATLGSTTRRARRCHRTTAEADARRPPQRSRRDGALTSRSRGQEQHAARSTTLIRASIATASGEPTLGMTRNGITNVADDRAERCWRRAAGPRSVATRAGSSPSRADEAGNVRPMTTWPAGPPAGSARRWPQLSARAAAWIERPGWPMTSDEAR